MKRTITLLAITMFAVASIAAQSKTEQEIRSFIADYDKAYMAYDSAFFEKNLADDYSYSGPTGGTQTKAEALEELKKSKSDKTYQLSEMKSEGLAVRVTGNVAVVTGTWVGTGTSVGGPSHTDRGRFTCILENRNGKWLVVTEHVSENMHDKKLMEEQVMKAGQAYNDMIKRNDAAAIENVLSADYMYTSSEGSLNTREQEIARFKSGKIKIDSAELTEQKVRIIGNAGAIETGKFHVKGKNDGKAFDEVERYTTTWTWRSGRWQIVADHTSSIKK